MKVLVTGGSGMIGSMLVPTLENANYEVYSLDRVEPKFTTPKNFVKWDLLKPIKETAELKNVDLIVHLAAHARVWELVEDPQKALENITTIHNTFEFARLNGVKKIMFASSREVYGNGNNLPINENTGSQRSAESNYSAGKIFGEAYCHAYSKCYGLDTQIVRFSNVYGKYDFSDRFIPKVIKALKADEKIEIWGKNKLLDFTYISDAIDGVRYLIEHWGKLTDKEWNVSYGKGLTLLSVAERMKEMLGSASSIETGESHPGEVFEYEADISRMKKIGWSPKVDIEEGLAKSIEYYTAQLNTRL